MKILITAILYFWSTSLAALSEGDVAPAFDLPVLGEAEMVSLAEHHGKVVYLDFWASWCGPCRISLPQISKLQEELGSSQFQVIAINLDKNQDRGIRFLRRFPVNYTVLSDPAGKVAKIYQLPGMPSSFIINQAGSISLTHTGFRQGDMTIIHDHIKKLLAQNE